MSLFMAMPLTLLTGLRCRLLQAQLDESRAELARSQNKNAQLARRIDSANECSLAKPRVHARFVLCALLLACVARCVLIVVPHSL